MPRQGPHARPVTARQEVQVPVGSIAWATLCIISLTIELAHQIRVTVNFTSLKYAWAHKITCQIYKYNSEHWAVFRFFKSFFILNLVQHILSCGSACV